MTAEQEKKLARLKNYRTRYELVLTDGQTRFLVCYTDSHSQRGAMRAARNRYDAIQEIVKGADVLVTKPQDAFEPGEWHIYFSGRTQRECILSESLPFIGKQPKICEVCNKPENVTRDAHGNTFTDFCKHATRHMECLYGKVTA